MGPPCFSRSRFLRTLKLLRMMRFATIFEQLEDELSDELEAALQMSARGVSSGVRSNSAG